VKELLVLGEKKLAQGTLRALGLTKRRGWMTGSTNLEGIVARRSLPDVTLVNISQGEGSEFDRLAGVLAAKQNSSLTASYVIFLCHHYQSRRKSEWLKILQRFPSPDRVQLFLSHRDDVIKAAFEAIEPTVEVLKASLPKAKEPEAPSPSMLDKMRKVLDATKDLRSDRGNLSAKLIADLYGIPSAELARWLGKTKAAVFKTPDADSIQSGLEYFERIARLRIAMSDADFRKWLRARNPLVGDKTPLQLIFDDKVQIVADLVADMITGRPS
jgi:Protein of unknown function (DUF2384)